MCISSVRLVTSNGRHHQHARKKIPSSTIWVSKPEAYYVPYAQGIPPPAIDRSMCIHFKTGRVQRSAQESAASGRSIILKRTRYRAGRGSIILATGFQPFDPSKYDTYSYSKLPNWSLHGVERILSALQVLLGHLAAMFRSQGTQKDRRGSSASGQGQHQCDHPSAPPFAVCMPSKEAVIARSTRAGDLDCAIFFT